MTDSRKLSGPTRRLIEISDQAFVSAASAWEVAIKVSSGKLDVDVRSFDGEIERIGLLELPVTVAHAARVAQLPMLHADPFDRLLVAQAIAEQLVLLTADERLGAYGPAVRMV